MTATIRLSASLKNLLGSKTEFTVEAGHSVRETIISLGIKPELVAMVSVNDVMVEKDHVIQEGEVVRLLAVIGGG